MKRNLRRIHALLGVFFAPSILFFSLTGSVQALGFHEQEWNPPAWLQHLAQVHKKQTWTVRKRRPPEPPATGAAPETEGAARPAGPPAPEPQKPTIARQALRTFAALLGLGLATTALLGVWMALQVPRDRRLVAVLLVVGTIVPIALLALA